MLSNFFKSLAQFAAKTILRMELLQQVRQLAKELLGPKLIVEIFPDDIKSNIIIVPIFTSTTPAYWARVMNIHDYNVSRIIWV